MFRNQRENKGEQTIFLTRFSILINWRWSSVWNEIFTCENQQKKKKNRKNQMKNFIQIGIVELKRNEMVASIVDSSA